MSGLGEPRKREYDPLTRERCCFQGGGIRLLANPWSACPGGERHPGLEAGVDWLRGFPALTLYTTVAMNCG